MQEKPNIIAEKPPGNRLIIGAIVFVSGFLSPLLIPLVLATDLSSAWKTAISGGLAVGVPELFMIIAAAILGKPGFAYLKQLLMSFLRKHGPPDDPGPVRYKIGLVMFVIPILLAWLLPYFGHHIPNYDKYSLWINISGDVLFFLSLFVLGGNFWDKLRSLFIYKSRAVMIEDTNDK